MLLSDLTIITPYGTNESSCGYCKSTRGSHTYGISAHFMSCQDYQDLIDRGWRRSGNYLYKPNLRDSCCPQYTIRMKALEYRASKHQRNLVNRFNRFVSQEGDETFEREIQERLKALSKSKMEKTPETTGVETAAKEDAETLGKGTATQPLQEEPPLSEAEAKARAAAETKRQKQKQKKVLREMPKTHVDKIHLAEHLRHPDQTKWKHRFKVKLEPASFTPEKHAVYVKYQVTIHNDTPSHVQASSFKRFLVDSPLKHTKPDDWTEQDPGYGSFHQCYYLDEKLIAVSVIDILPSCVSAVYFYYDPDYSILSLGKYSAQREIALVQELHQNPDYTSLQFYYMGFYIFTCPKMSYKAQYEPSFLLDPETYSWVELEKCTKILGNKRYSTWENPEELDPLFEEQVQLIRDTKQGDKRRDEDDDEDEDDQWDSVDEDDDMEDDLDPDEFMSKAVEDPDVEEQDLVKDGGKEEGEEEGKGAGHEHGDDVDDQDSNPRKRAKQGDSAASAPDTADTTAAKEEEEKKKKEQERLKREEAAAHAKERMRVYNEIKAQRPPGWLDPKKVGQEQLSEVLCLQNQNELLPLVRSSQFKRRKDVQANAAEYYAAVGDELAKRMIVFYG